MEKIRKRGRIKFNMVEHMDKRWNCLSQWVIVIMLGVGIVLCFSPSAESKSIRESGNEGILPEQKHRGDMAFPNRIADSRHSQKEKNYNNLSPRERDILNRKIEKWKSLPPERKNLLRHRMYQWKDLPPDERRIYRKRFDQLQNLPPEERKIIRKKLKEWKHLPPQEKEEIRRRFRTP